ncbi:hypothetical protein TrRE_jg1805, partial [Triparma retinervis]
TTHFSPLIYFLSVSVIWSQVLLSLLDLQAVLSNSTGFFFSAYKAAMTLSTSTPIHRAPPAPLAALHWTFAMIFVAFVFLYREKKLSAALSSVRAVFTGGYSAIPPAEPNSTSNSSSKNAFEPKPYTRAYSFPPTPETYNYFDPADLPPRLAEYAMVVYSACEDIGNFFGFQDSSVRNQAEHLLVLLSNKRRYMTTAEGANPISILHKKTFGNYVEWCRSVGATPGFSKGNVHLAKAPPMMHARIVDLVLYFCIWGEGANLRHMPECLCFLYHKMHEAYSRSDRIAHQTRSLYPGHFLDNVVSPLYQIVAKNMKSKADHDNRKNYDDFNEFFWSSKCLRYHYRQLSNDVDSMMESGVIGDEGSPLPSVSFALETAPKTFLEKRSCFRGILALSRVIEWNVLTFYLLAVVAFSKALVWGWVYSLQVASGVFWLMNALHLFWAVLEVWAVYPNIELSGTAVTGHLLSLVTRYLILIYQSIYLMWTFGRQGGGMNFDADAAFWWWQYVWLSAIIIIPYTLEAVFQLWPYSSTLLYTSENDYIQSFLNIVSPLSRLYVNKRVYERVERSLVYVVFWVTLLAFKLTFSYYFEVSSMVLPTLELTDDYVNYPDQNFYKMAFLVVIRWSPQFIVYTIDTSIWYALWQAFAGTVIGFEENLGDIKNFDDIRSNFTKAPDSFCSKLVSTPELIFGSSSNMLDQVGKEAETRETGETSSLLGNSNRNSSYASNALRDGFTSATARLLDVRVQKWVFFAEAWNEIIDNFREEDIISNREMGYLKFSRFDNFKMPIYLPVFQTAGVVDVCLASVERVIEEAQNEGGGYITDDNVLDAFNRDVTMVTSISEVWELGSYLCGVLLGSVHAADVKVVFESLSNWVEQGIVSENVDLKKLRGVLTAFSGVVAVLEKGLGRRKARKVGKEEVGREEVDLARGEEKVVAKGGFRKSVSTNSLSALKDLSMPAREPVERAFPQRKKLRPNNVLLLDALRDQVRDKMRAFAHSIKGIVKNKSTGGGREISDRLTFLLSMENGFIWNDTYASGQLDVVSKNKVFCEVLNKVNGLINTHPDDVEPKSKEAKRRLTFFVNSLFMDIPNAPSMADMQSWNVMTPFYSEDVTYNKGDLMKKEKTLGVSVLLYLQTLYKADWINFVERMKIADESRIWDKKYATEVRRWASIRAQTLSRTVSGMMLNEKALRLLAKLEGHDKEAVDELICEKFGYVVACQVYGRMKKEQDSKAEDIEDLMHRFPHMRVAYIDTVRVNREGESVFFSVLVKSNGAGKIEEIYRVRLPGNPVIGEGKPENQNHAVIFTRGEMLQTIDMNQEGFFEEALKMRNLLQEFDHGKGSEGMPTTIVGFREHIFTGSVSSLANYMALQETSFVTLGQRVLNKPLCSRLHYGHPDIFDKLFFMTRGGVSKASKGINLSEDIFAGYNNLVRGGGVDFKEYVQCGKGRDVGGQQIYKFEAKLSQGNAEQSLSRDVYRVAQRVDFFRLLSTYFGGIGHYCGNVLTVFTVYLVCYLMLGLALYDCEKIGDRKITPSGTLQMLLGGMGLMNTIPLFATLGVERGWWASMMEIFQVFVTGGPLHFMFHIQTKAHYFAQTILVGGAKYRATGRGFVTQHSPFCENFRFFASSHLYLGVELSAALVLMGVYTDAGQYFGRTWSLWLACVSFLAAPFWFNPLTFEWAVVRKDYDEWMGWMSGKGGGALKSWQIWFLEENSFYRGLNSSSKLFFLSKAVIYSFIGEGIRKSELFHMDFIIHKPTVDIGLLIGAFVVLLCVTKIFSMIGGLSYGVRRGGKILLSVATVIVAAMAIVEDTNLLRYAIAGYYFAGGVLMVGLLTLPASYTMIAYKIHDLVCGHIIFVVLFLLSALQFPAHVQTWLLYHNALSSDVVIEDILKYSRRSQEKEGGRGDADVDSQVDQLRAMIMKQDALLQKLVRGNAGEVGGDGLERNESTDALAVLVSENDNSVMRDIAPQVQLV